MNTIVSYERRYTPAGSCVSPIDGQIYNVIRTTLIKVTRQYGWLNNKWTVLRVSESPLHGRKTEASYMHSSELDGWGSVKLKQVPVGSAIRLDLMERGFIRPPSYDQLPCLPVDVWAVKSHIEDMERVSRGEQPTQPYGMTEDSDPYAYGESYEN